MTETPPPEKWLLTTATTPYWAIALALLIAVVIFAIFNFLAGQPTSNPSNIQKRFGLVTWSRRTAHFVIGLWGCALAMLMGAFLLTTFQLIQEILATSNQDIIRQLAIALPAVAAASAGLIALPITLNRLQLTSRQTQAEEEGLITDRINAAVLGLGAEKTVKVTEDGEVIERTEPNIEVRIGAILALERIAKNNLDVHVQIMELLCAYIRENANIPRENQHELLSLRASMSLQYGRNENAKFNKIIEFEQLPEISKSGQDIQTAINVLGHRPLHAIDEEKKMNFKVDLSDCFFHDVWFRDDFNCAKFHNTFMLRCAFEKTKLNRTRILNCFFYGGVFYHVSANEANIMKTYFAENKFADYCEAKKSRFNETFFTNDNFEPININEPTVIVIADSNFNKCRYQNTTLPSTIRFYTRFEECSIVRRPTER